MFCWTRDLTLWRSAWMTSAQLWSRRHHWPWADVIRADFQTVISRYLHNVNTRLFCTADRMFTTIIILNSRLIYACFPIKIDEVWIDRFCVRYDWWRRLQPTSSVSPVWYSTTILKQHNYDNKIATCWISKHAKVVAFCQLSILIFLLAFPHFYC